MDAERKISRLSNIPIEGTPVEEVHAVTCTQRDGIQQIAHGGLIGRTTKPNYLLVTVHEDKLELNLKEIDLINGKGRLWQKDKSKGPWDTITAERNNPLSPPSDPVQRRLQSPPAKSNFLAVSRLYGGN